MIKKFPEIIFYHFSSDISRAGDPVSHVGTEAEDCGCSQLQETGGVTTGGGQEEHYCS